MGRGVLALSPVFFLFGIQTKARQRWPDWSASRRGWQRSGTPRHVRPLSPSCTHLRPLQAYYFDNGLGFGRQSYMVRRPQLVAEAAPLPLTAHDLRNPSPHWPPIYTVLPPPPPLPQATGRNFVLRHVPLDEVFRSTAHSHLYLGAEAAVLLCLTSAHGTWESVQVYFYLFTTQWLFAMSLLFGSGWFNPFQASCVGTRVVKATGG
jgi:hypothetical protein